MTDRDPQQAAAALVGKRVRFADEAQLAGAPTMTVTHAQHGMVMVTGYVGWFAAHLLVEVTNG